MLVFFCFFRQKTAYELRIVDWSSDVFSSDLGYAYDNIPDVVAGELVAAVSGQSWESFIRDRVFRAAGMADSVSDETERFANPNRAHPHARIDGPVRGLGTQVVLPEIGRASGREGGCQYV